MTMPWPPHGLPEALLRTASTLTTRGLAAQYYTAPDCDAFRSVTGRTADVHGLDIRLGSAQGQPGRSTHCALTVFDPALPNLGLYICYDRDDETGQPIDDRRLPTITPDLDRTITYTLMPELNTVLNPFDRNDGGRSVVVGCWRGRPTLPGLAIIPITAAKLLRSFPNEGQAALIWTDFRAPLAAALSRMMLRLTRAQRVHLLPRTRKPAEISIPVRDNNDQYHRLTDLSRATTDGIRIAQGYLRAPQVADIA